MQKSASTFSSLFNINPVPTFLYELDTCKILDVNKAALALFGYTRKEILSLTIVDLSLEEDRDRLLAAHQGAQNEETNIFFGQFNQKLKSGELIAVNINGYTTDFSGAKCVVAVFQENTVLVKQESKANQMVDSSLDVFCIINELGNFVDVSAAAFYHWGYLPEELIGTPYLNLVLEEDVSKTIEVAASVLNGNDIKSFVNRYKKKNGGIAFNLWSVRWDDTLKQMYGVARDTAEKIKQEEKTQLSEQRFKALVQEGSDLIRILDAKGNFIYVSPTSTSILGLEPEKFIGKNLLDFVHPEDFERTSVCFQKITFEQRVVIEPYRIQNSSKEWRWFETTLTNMLENPAVKGIVSNSKDITVARNARLKIEATELFNGSILESSTDCLKILDSDGRIQFMNINGLCQMEIDDFSKLKDKKWHTLWGSENEALVTGSIARALKGETTKFSAFCPTAKGTPKWWDVLVSPVGKNGDPVNQIISISRDVTEKRVEEQQLKLLESVITNTKDAILITEAEPYDAPAGPRIIYVNAAFTKMTGYEAEEVIGKTPRMLQGPNSDLEELAKLGRAIRKGDPCEITIINYKKSGQEYWTNFTVTPVLDEKGSCTHYFAIQRDVTEQKIKELEKELITQISINFNAANNYVNATNEVCKLISMFGKFDWVEVWSPNLEKSEMQLFSHFFSDPNDEKLLRSVVRNI
jgi:PAS domain S-box-containing protein